MRGRHGSASMSAIEWIGSSQVIRSRWGSSRSAVAGSSAGSSIHASGSPSITRRYRPGSGVHRHGDVAVGALQVDDVDAAQARELADDVVVPARRRVQLEAQPRGPRRAAPAAGARLGGSPIRTDATKLTGSARRPTASWSERPFWRSARSSAALSNAQRR